MNEELKVIIKAEIAQFKQGMEQAKSSIQGFKAKVNSMKGEADKVIKNMGKSFADLGKKIAKAFVAGCAAAGAAVLALGKKALSAYGDYEQLVGGIDTLFKESSETVQAYARDAYKNQQMSANQYMQMATSFSAGLIASVGGDTAKAAQIANMAITDMADNANRMGSTMESIQNAYQGFAKQNYTMLDNLKLGYGGTKQEMERLLVDATKLTGIKYDINNLSDVYNAIHAIQEEMGITGATADEAAKTIQGSVAMMKAAWMNWLVGLMDDNADIGQLTKDLISSVGTVVDNIKPRVKQFFESFVEGVHTALEPYPALQAMFDGIVSALQTVQNTVSAVVGFVVQNWATLQPVLIAVAAVIGVIVAAVAMYNAVAAIKLAMDAAQVATLGALAAATWAALAPYLLIAAAIAALIAIIVLCITHWDAIKAKVSEVCAAIGNFVSSMVGKVKEWFGNMKSAISEKVDAIKAEASEKWATIKGVITNAVAVAKEQTKAHLSAMKQAYQENGGGIKGIVAGLGTGIKSLFSATYNNIDTLTGGKLSAIRDKFGSILGQAREKVKGVLDKIKSFFNFNWSLPHLKMPHISISGSFSLSPPSVPRFAISWYARGGVFDAPTLFNYGNGALGGLGEHGAEAVVPLENNTEWLDKIAERLAAGMGGSNTPIILQVDGKTFAEISVDSINALTRQRGSLGINLV